MKDTYRYQGEVLELGQTKEIGSKGFRIRPIVLKTVDNGWTDYVQFDAVYDAVDASNNINEGDLVELEFTIGGRQWINHSKEVKYFNKLEVRKITVIEKSDRPGVEYNNADVPF